MSPFTAPFVSCFRRRSIPCGLLACLLLAACLPLLAPSGVPFRLLAHANTFFLAGLATWACWRRGRLARDPGFQFFALSAGLTGLRYLPALLRGSLPAQPEASLSLSVFSLAAMAAGMLLQPSAGPRQGERATFAMDAGLAALWAFTLSFFLVYRFNLRPTLDGDLLDMVIPLSATFGLLALWSLVESHSVQRQQLPLILIRVSIALLGLHHFAALLLHLQGAYRGAPAVVAELFSQGSLACLGWAAVAAGAEPLSGPAEEERPGPWRQGLPAALAAGSLGLSLFIIAQVQRPAMRLLWSLAVALLGLLIVRIWMMAWSLRNLAATLESRVAARTRELEREHAELMQAQRLQLVAGLAAGFAHDLNGLIGAVRIRLDLLKLNGLDAEAAHQVQAIEAVVDRASTITHRILEAREMGPGRPQVLDLQAWLAQEEELLQTFLAPGQRLEIKAEGRPKVFADPEHLTQILQNLLTNARDAMGAEGVARVAADPSSEGRLRLTVEDSGPGIPEALRDRLFEPFFTTKGKGKGTGLGLATVKGLVLQNRGKIQVECPPGGGTRFLLDLPAGPA